MANPAPPAGAIAPLAGFTVAIASDRRRHRLADLLESVGARTIGVQAARSVAKPDPAVLREVTERCLAAPCDELVASSALGMRAWLTAARGWGLAQPLTAAFGRARLLARDPAAADVLRRLGFSEIFSTERETTEDLLRHLAAQPLTRRRIVVQTDRLSLVEACDELRRAGAEVIEAPTFTAQPPAESFSLRRLGDLLVRRQVDALALVGATPAEQLRGQAGREGRIPAVAAALHEDVFCAGLGPRTMAALGPLGGGRRAGATPVPLDSGDRAGAARPLAADRPYVEELAEAVLTTLPQRGLQLAVAGHQLEVRGQAVILDGRLISVPGGPISVLRALAREPGRVLSPAEIRGSEPIWDDVDDHAVEMAVSRLRQLLRGADLVQTIVRRGYRLVV